MPEDTPRTLDSFRTPPDARSLSQVTGVLFATSVPAQVEDDLILQETILDGEDLIVRFFEVEIVRERVSRPDFDRLTFGEIIAEQEEQLGDQEGLAGLYGRSRRTIRRWKKRRTRPRTIERADVVETQRRIGAFRIERRETEVGSFLIEGGDIDQWIADYWAAFRDIYEPGKTYIVR